jgi:hypothetical protein
MLDHKTRTQFEDADDFRSYILGLSAEQRVRVVLKIGEVCGFSSKAWINLRDGLISGNFDIDNLSGEDAELVASILDTDLEGIFKNGLFVEELLGVLNTDFEVEEQ